MHDLGAEDARVRDFLSNVFERVGVSFAHKLQPLIEQYAQLFKSGARTPVLRRPDVYDMAYEDGFFPASDGVPLEGWFIPSDSDGLLMVNHPMTCNRYGFPGHLLPWNVMFGGFEVNFLQSSSTSMTPATTSSPTTCATAASTQVRQRRSSHNVQPDRMEPGPSISVG